MIILFIFNRLELEAKAANEEKIRRDTEIRLAEEAVAEISRLLLETEFQVLECVFYFAYLLRLLCLYCPVSDDS